MAYLQIIHPSIKTGILFPKGIICTSKRGKNSKKVTNASTSKPDHVPTQMKVTKPIQVPDPTEPTKEVVPSKSGVLKKV